ncbi:DUF1707 domain-containing protein [Solicola gregarius]|uniref:DUF1707 domain-containing protein n=1 Tax=Solicola gregarius TaxID=2908642 RepID=A0AA46YN91_9ACTN|nr:DUF1707 domain-containing protein [Solicola gregarius]UYM06493.1 DUF1707 domain-containing protein [Solicola gregarius]
MSGEERARNERLYERDQRAMSGELRIGDQEREAAVAALGEHFAAGRIDKSEYDERTAVAWEARTSGALKPLFADLPAPGPTGAAEPERAPRAAPAYEARGPWTGWYRVAGILVVGLAIALAIATRIPWFVVIIAAWIVWMKGHRFKWHRNRHHQWHRYAGWR